MSLSCPKPFREDTYPTKIQATPHSSLSHHLNRRERDSQKGVLSLLICSILSQESWADREGIYPLIRFCSQQQEGFSWGWAGPWWPLPPHICHSTWPNDYQVSPGSFLFFDLFSGLVLFFFTLFYFTILYWFCHTLTWIHHWCTCVPKHEPPSHLPPYNVSLGHPRAPAPSILYPASDIDWWFNSYMIVYMFQCISPKSSHPLPLSPKVCYTHLCLFCCLAYRVIIAIFLNSIYMC